MSARRIRLPRVTGGLVLLACGVAHAPTHHRGNALRLAPIAGLDLLMSVPDENPLTIEGVAVGERLFFDPLLSVDGSVRCASCHRPDRAFSDSVPLSRGVFGRRGRRNAPAIVNRGYGRAFFWDGRARSLEDQVLHPVQDPVEMGQPITRLVRRLRADRAYADAFALAFGTLDSGTVARALASYVRTLRAGNAPFDRWRDGDTAALSPEARRGQVLFAGRANCIVCHVGPNFSDEDFHNTGVSARSARTTAGFDSGRARITGRAADVGAFKTPTLREVVRTPPYMHDGSLATLEDVVAFYDGGGFANPHLDPDIAVLRLTKNERADLVAFLLVLSGGTLNSGGSRGRPLGTNR